MVTWKGNEFYSTLYINNEEIGRLFDYNDEGESYGWSFQWDYGVMKYDYDNEYFVVSETNLPIEKFDEVKRDVELYVKEILGKQCLAIKRLYDSI